MPKVLRIINRFNLGGITYNVTYLSKYMSPEFETMLIGGDKEPGEDSSLFIPEQLGLKPMLIPELKRAINWSDDKKAYQRIKQIIQEFKPDIVHTHASKAGAIGRLAAFNQKVPVVVHTFHGHVFHSYFGKAKTAFYKNVERYLAKRSSAIIAISDKQKHELTEIHKIVSPEKTHVINLGFDLNKFIDDKEGKRSDFRKKYLLDDDEIAIVIIGRLAPIKNHDMFLRCLKNILATTTKKVRAFIVGDGETRSHIENKAKELNIDFVDFLREQRKAPLTLTSWITNVDWALAGCDVVCLTSFNEGTPVSLIEAQAAGKPVVTTDVGGVRDVVSLKTGFLTEVDDDKLFTEKILALIEDASLRNTMGSLGWEVVGKQFHYTRLVSDMEKLYNNLLRK
ncbi:MAG TPA: glycosyltransferase [Bacteroidia bacterium]